MLLHYKYQRDIVQAVYKIDTNIKSIGFELSHVSDTYQLCNFRQIN